MTLQDDINSLDSDKVQESLRTVTDLMQTDQPEVRGFTAGGQLEALVSEPLAIGVAWTEQEMDKQDASFSLQTIADNPDQADDALVDLRLSDYFVTRTDPTSSVGSVGIVVNVASIFPIREGYEFSANGFQYQTTQSYRLYPPETGRAASETDLIWRLRADGLYEVLIPLTSVQTGASTNIVRGTTMTPETAIPNAADISASSDFTGGSEGDTNADLVARAQEGIVPDTFNGSRQIEDLIERSFPGALARTVGAGNALMVRDRANLFGISVGGKADIYVRTVGEPVTETIAVNATLTPANRAANRWILSYSEPGSYRTLRVRLQDQSSSGFPVETETISADFTSSGFVPFIEDDTAFFSAHQRRNITFIDDVTDYGQLLMGVGPTDDVVVTYDVDFEAMQNIDLVDLFARSDERRDSGLDPLVRAAVPCTVDLTVQVRGTVIDTTAAQEAIVADILRVPAGDGVIPGGLVYSALQPFVNGSIGTVTFRYTIIDPTTSQPIFGNARGELELPEQPEKFITKESVMFMTSAARITLEVI